MGQLKKLYSIKKLNPMFITWPWEIGMSRIRELMTIQEAIMKIGIKSLQPLMRLDPKLTKFSAWRNRRISLRYYYQMLASRLS